MLFDSHCHLQDRRFDEDREAVIARALEHLDGLVVIGDDWANSELGVSYCRDRVYAAIGYHPYHAVDVDGAALERLRALAGHPGVKAIGEIGLDYYNEFSPRPAQRAAFAQQLELASGLELPVVIHNRQADEDTMAILTEAFPRLRGGIMHCFGSDARFAGWCVEMGLYVSFAGNVTFPKAEALREAVRVTPLDRLLVETDAPYLAPVPLRGKRCEPHFVAHTAACLAALKNVSPEGFAEQTTRNAHKIYAIDD